MALHSLVSQRWNRMYVKPTVVSGSTFVRTFEGRIHKISGREGHVKDLLRFSVCKNVSSVLLALICNIWKPPLSVLFPSYKSFAFHLMLFILHVYRMCCVEHTCFWWLFCLNFLARGRNDTIQFLRTQEC